MRQLLLGLLGRIRRETPPCGLGSALMGLALVVVVARPLADAGAQAVPSRTWTERSRPTPTPYTAAIRQSGNVGALAFLDAKDGRLVVLRRQSGRCLVAVHHVAGERIGRVSAPRAHLRASSGRTQGPRP